MYHEFRLSHDLIGFVLLNILHGNHVEFWKSKITIQVVFETGLALQCVNFRIFFLYENTSLFRKFFNLTTLVTRTFKTTELVHAFKQVLYHRDGRLQTGKVN